MPDQPQDPTPVTMTTEKVCTILVCPHAPDYRRGGNDYTECLTCGLTWDYRRERPEDAATRTAVRFIREAQIIANAKLADLSEMCCEQHPELAWPHDDCAGPGCPISIRPMIVALQRRLAAQALRERDVIASDAGRRVFELDAALTEEQGKREQAEEARDTAEGLNSAYADTLSVLPDRLDQHLPKAKEYIAALRTRAEQAERERDEWEQGRIDAVKRLDKVRAERDDYEQQLLLVIRALLEQGEIPAWTGEDAADAITALRAKVEALERLAVEMRAAADEAYTARAYGVSDALHLFAGRAETSVARTATTPWRSVDLAPKNEWVLVHPQTCGHIAHFVLMNGNLFVWRNEAGRLIDPPTHWMPLPALPTSAAPTPARTTQPGSAE